MKFSARSYSPSPARGKYRGSSTFGVQSDSESEEYDSELDSHSTLDEDDDVVSIVSDSSSDDSFMHVTSGLKNLAMCVFRFIRCHNQPNSLFQSFTPWSFATGTETYSGNSCRHTLTRSLSRSL